MGICYINLPSSTLFHKERLPTQTDDRTIPVPISNLQTENLHLFAFFFSNLICLNTNLLYLYVLPYLCIKYHIAARINY